MRKNKRHEYLGYTWWMEKHPHGKDLVVYIQPPKNSDRLVEGFFHIAMPPYPAPCGRMLVGLEKEAFDRCLGLTDVIEERIRDTVAQEMK